MSGTELWSGLLSGGEDGYPYGPGQQKNRWQDRREHNAAGSQKRMGTRIIVNVLNAADRGLKLHRQSNTGWPCRFPQRGYLARLRLDSLRYLREFSQPVPDGRLTCSVRIPSQSEKLADMEDLQTLRRDEIGINRELPCWNPHPLRVYNRPPSILNIGAAVSYGEGPGIEKWKSGSFGFQKKVIPKCSVRIARARAARRSLQGSGLMRGSSAR